MLYERKRSIPSPTRPEIEVVPLKPWSHPGRSWPGLHPSVGPLLQDQENPDLSSSIPLAQTYRGHHERHRVWVGNMAPWPANRS